MRHRVQLARAFGVLLLILLTLTGVSRAEAHGDRPLSDPSPGQVLAGQPQRVTLSFDQTVTAGPAAIRVFDDQMHRVDLGRLPTATPERVIRTTLPGGLPNGTYTVSWHVTTADTHPASGTYQFSIGTTSDSTALVPPLTSDPTHSADTTTVNGVLRALGYIGLALGPGAFLVALWFWPIKLNDRRTRRLIWSGMTLLALSILATSLSNPTLTSGLPLGNAWNGTGLGTEPSSANTALQFRFYSLLALAALLTGAHVSHTGAARHLPAQRAIRLATLPTAALLLLTWPMTGHAAASHPLWLGLALNFTHITAMTIWLGGLSLIAGSLISRQPRTSTPEDFLPTFSRLAFGCVAVLAITGVLQASRQLNSLPDLATNPYGKMLLAKLVGVTALIALASRSRSWVQRGLPATPSLPPPEDPAANPAQTQTALAHHLPFRTLRHCVLLELATALTILALTATLSLTSPPA